MSGRLASKVVVLARMYGRGEVESMLSRWTSGTPISHDWTGVPVSRNFAPTRIGRVLDTFEDADGGVHVVVQLDAALVPANLYEMYLTTGHEIDHVHGGVSIVRNTDVALCTQSMHKGATPVKLVSPL